jgi:cyanophycin synthetase
MEVSRTRALRGPNLWSRHTAFECIFACSEDERDINRLPGFEARLRARFPTIDLQPPSGGRAISLAHVQEAAALSLQVQVGCTVTFSLTKETVEPGTYQVVVEYSEEPVGRLAVEMAETLIRATLDDTPFDLDDALFRLKDLDGDVRLGPSTGAIVYAGVARGIPYRRLTEGSLVQFGWGSKQRRIQAAETDLSSAIAESIAQDKELTKKLLHAAGVPVPLGRPVEDADDAWAAAQEIGGPVVVKPQDGNQGKGITVNVSSREDVMKAYDSAREHRRHILVERFLPGHDFRFLVIGKQLVAAARRDPAQVIGDGTHNIKELVDIVNADPRRGTGHESSLTRIRFDDIAIAHLAKKDYTPETVPAKGERVMLRNNANLSTGGTATDVTDEVHPELAACAVAAAQTVGLDIAGIDVVCQTVQEPLEAQGGGIVEVNAAPGLRMHLTPSFGKGRPIGEAIINMMYEDPNEDGRIPIVAVTGTNGKTTTTRLISHLLTVSGLRVGFTGTDGVYVERRRIDTGDCSGPKSARNVLLHPDVDAAVLECARGGMLREGLGFDKCDVAVVTNVGVGDHLGLNFITTVDDLAVVKRVVVDNVAEFGYAVLNATDPMVVKMASHCPGAVIFFAIDRNHPVMSRHRAQGKRVVYVENGAIVAAQGNSEHRVPLEAIPLTRGGSIGFQVENAMAATAAAWALDMDWESIRAGLGSFVSDASTAPGRFNVFSYKGATLIADYGHNPDAIQALAKAIETMPAKRRLVVISAAGDRRDEDIRQQTQTLGDVFDEVILYEDACMRGRDEGETIALLRAGLTGARRTGSVDEIKGEFLAIDTALGRLASGDLCLILVDQVEEALAHISKQVAEA